MNLLLKYSLFIVLFFGVVSSAYAQDSLEFQIEKSFQEFPVSFEYSVMENPGLKSEQYFWGDSIRLEINEEQGVVKTSTKLKASKLIKEAPYKLKIVSNFYPADQGLLNLKKLGREEGFPFRTYAMYISPDDIVYLGLSNGFVQIKGNEARVYNVLSGLDGNYVNKIVGTKEGVWLSSYGGGLYFFKDGNIEVYDKESGLENNFITDMQVDDNDRINLSYYGNKWAKLEGRLLENFSVLQAENFFISNHKDRVYLSGGGNYQIYDKDKNSLSVLAKPEGINSNFVDFLKFNGQLIGLSEDGKLYRISQNFIQELKWEGKEDSFLSVSSDSSGLWALSNSGKICQFGANGFVNFYELSDKRNLGNYNLYASDKRLFLQSNSGLYLHLPSNFQRVLWDESKNGLLTGIWNFNQLMYFPYQGGLGVYDPKTNGTYLYKSKELNDIRDLCEFNGQLFISSINGLFVLKGDKLIKYSSGNPSLNAFGSMEVYEGRLWIANYYFGFLVFNGKQFSTFKTWYQPGETHPGYTVRKIDKGLGLSSGKGFGIIKNNSFYEYNAQNSDLLKGKIYASTAFGDSVLIGGQAGLFLLRNGKIKQLFTSIIPLEGVMDFVAFKNNILILCRENILVYDRTKKLIVANVQDLGLGEGYLAYDSHFKMGEDVYLASGSAIIQFRPDEKIPGKAPKLQYSLIEENGVKVSEDSLKLFAQKGIIKYKGQGNINLSMEFNCIYLGRESNLNYYYSFDSDEWVGPFHANRLDFTDIGFGHHHIRLKAVGLDGQESNILHYHFTLEKAYYQKTWFWAILVGMVGILGMIWYWRNQDFEIEKLSSYLDGSLMNSKMKICGLLGFFFIPAIEFLYSSYFQLYPAWWSIMGTLSLTSLFIYISARYHSLSSKILYLIVVVVYTVILSIAVHRVFDSNYSILLIGELAVIITLSVVVLETRKHFILFALYTVALCSIALMLKSELSDGFISMVVLSAQALTISAIYFVLEDKKFKQIIFANKIVKNAEIYIISSNKNSEVVYINNHMARVLGYQPHELLGNDYWEKLNRSNEEKAQIKKNLLKTIETGKPITYENFLATKDGFRRVNWTDTVVENKYLIGIGKDITEEYEARLRSKELNEIIERANDIIFKSDREGNFIFVNEAASDLTGYSMEELTSMTYRDLTHKDDLERVDEICRGIIERKEKHGYTEFRVNTKSGVAKWVKQNLITQFNPETGRFEGFSSILRDETEQKFYENQLERLSLVAEKTTNTVIIFGVSGAVEWVNKSFEKDFGFTEKEILGKHPSEILHDKSNVAEVERLEKLNLDLSQGKSHTNEFEMLTKSGKKWFNISIDPVFNEEGKMVKYVGILSDFTAIKEQQKLIEFQNKNIVDSINYAQRIQQSVLPQSEKQNRLFPNALFFLRQKDTIGGDFFWLDIVQNRYLILVGGDCTGHGVPGAFMTLLGTNAIDYIVGEKKVTDPVKILNYVHRKLTESVGAGSQDEQVSHDGMELAILCIDLEEEILHYTGAGRPLWEISSDESFKEYEAERYTLGDIFTDKPDFVKHSIKIAEEKQFYIFSDGIHDQFGGDKNRKYSKRKFKELLVELAFLDSELQEKKIQEELEAWTSVLNTPQTDDQLLIGLSLSSTHLKKIKTVLNDQS